MVFSSIIFLWLFLPITFLIYYIVPHSKIYLRNIFLLLTSLLFYSWGGGKDIFLLLLVIGMNYIFGIILEKINHLFLLKVVLIVSIISNILILGYFKYFNFIVSNLNLVISKEIVPLKNIILPIGISFYVFQAISYIIDIYKSKIAKGSLNATKDITQLALYISFFPQLIAGPIVRYEDIYTQLKDRTNRLEDIVYGIRRFIYGLSKKVLISNNLSIISDKVFLSPIPSLDFLTSWIGISCYTLQIYFDFSGYSDMAIGLGKMFGFSFKENFNYPYLSASIKEFWQRWHISLSTWFKEYVYIPLGGNRRSKFFTYRNLLIVFFLTGLWHGASWHFIIWGLFHGCFLIVERIGFEKILIKNKLKILNHIYVLIVVMTGWVFFRASSISYAIGFIKKMFMPTDLIFPNSIILNLDKKILFIFISAILFSGVIQKYFYKKRVKIVDNIIQIILLLACIITLAVNTYQPFIYFQF